jgi:hypothetical protein
MWRAMAGAWASDYNIRSGARVLLLPKQLRLFTRVKKLQKKEGTLSVTLAVDVLERWRPE